MEFSVLMSVYKNENVDWFKGSINSILCNSKVPNQIVLVRDGEVYSELQDAIDLYINQYPNLFTYLPLKENKGLGNALSIGLTECKYELVARMDTDDISVWNRFELQVKAFKENPELEMIGGQIVEFSNNLENIIGQRIVPVNHEDIITSLKVRSAFNHPSVMFKKSTVIAVGGYIAMHFVEDYYLWLRMMLNNTNFGNLPDVIVKMRVNLEMYRRRGGIKYFKAIKQLEQFKRNNKIIGIFFYMKNILIRFIQCVLLPNKLRGWLYRKVLRRI